MIALRAAACLLAVLMPVGVAAEVLRVGPGEAFEAPSQAARAAREGDTIVIAPGEYFDCAVWPQSRIVITGPEDPATPAVLSDAACQGKALFVVMGQAVTIRHLTFTRVRVGDGNGAGIRAEGRGLVVAHSRFVNNQSGILAADQPDDEIAVLDSRFERNGAAIGPRCVATLQIGGLARLRIERSVFTDARACDMVRAWATRTEIIDSRFEDGARGAAGRMVALAGGSLLVRDSVFARGPMAAADAAIEMRALWGAADIEVRGTVLENASARPHALVRHLAGGAVRMEDNRVGVGDVALDASGLWMARVRSVVGSGVATARRVAGKVKQVVRSVLPF